MGQMAFSLREGRAKRSYKWSNLFSQRQRHPLSLEKKEAMEESDV
jgi:hypothetical protein